VSLRHEPTRLSAYNQSPVDTPGATSSVLVSAHDPILENHSQYVNTMDADPQLLTLDQTPAIEGQNIDKKQMKCNYLKSPLILRTMIVTCLLA
jgi:hypothetical protein